MNQVVLFGQAQLQLLIVSEKYEALREKLLRDLDVGVSMIYIETGLGKKRRMAVLCVIPQRKLYAANELIRQIDVNAFTMISRVKEVKGRGFSLERVPVEHSRTGAFQQEKERRESPQLMMGAAHLNFIQAIYIGPAVLKRNNLPLDLLTVI